MPEVIDHETGEVIERPERALTVRPDVAGELEEFKADSAIARYHEAMRFLQEVCKGDWLELGGKPYLRIEGLQKLANAIGLSTTIVERWVENPTNGVREFWYRVDCAGPRRTTSGVGCCTTTERFARGKDPSAIAGMALTRATGSAIRRYFGLTGPSAEEVQGGGGEEPDVPITPKQIGKIMALAVELGARKGMDEKAAREAMDQFIYKKFKVDSKSKLTLRQGTAIIDRLVAKKLEEGAPPPDDDRPPDEEYE